MVVGRLCFFSSGIASSEDPFPCVTFTQTLLTACSLISVQVERRLLHNKEPCLIPTTSTNAQQHLLCFYNSHSMAFFQDLMLLSQILYEQYVYTVTRFLHPFKKNSKVIKSIKTYVFIDLMTVNVQHL